MTSDSKGFTLAEVLVAVLLAGFVLGGLAGIYATGLRFQMNGFRRMVVKNNVLTGLKTLQAQLSQATCINIPAAVGGAAGSVIQAGINLRPNSPPTCSAVALAPGAMRYVHFCVSTVNCPLIPGIPGPQNCLYYYSGAWPPPAIACGTTAGGTILATPLGTDILVPPNIFTRPTSNVIHADLMVLRPGDIRSAPAASYVVVDIRTQLPDN